MPITVLLRRRGSCLALLPFVKFNKHVDDPVCNLLEIKMNITSVLSFRNGKVTYYKHKGQQQNKCQVTTLLIVKSATDNS